MSVELQKAIEIECKKKIKNNDYDNKEECTNHLIESLHKIGIVSVTRINDEEIQKEIEVICVFKKKVGAIAYNKCIHEQVYAYLDLEIIKEIPLVVNEPIVDNIIPEDEDNEENQNTEDEEENEELDIEKIVVDVNPDLPITNPKVIPMPNELLRKISPKAIPSTYYVITWKKNPDQTKKKKYIPGGSGSAVAIAPDLLATACHVVTDIKFINDKIEYEYLITNVIHVDDNVSDQSKWIRKLELYAEDFSTDRCILKHSELNAIPAITRNFEELKPFEIVYAVGNPRGYLGKTAEGMITRLYDFVPPVPTLFYVFKSKEIEIIETNAPVDKGNSGGGLFDINANLIGIASRCEIVGGPKTCYDSKGNQILNPTNVGEQCTQYCNKTQPQNWFIPISRYPELADEIN